MVRIDVPSLDGTLYRYDEDEFDWVEVVPEKHGVEWFDKDGTYESQYRFGIVNDDDEEEPHYTTLYSYEYNLIQRLKRSTKLDSDKISYESFLSQYENVVSNIFTYVSTYAFKEPLTYSGSGDAYFITTKYLFDRDMSGHITDLDCKIYTIDDNYNKTYYQIYKYDIQEGVLWIENPPSEDETLYIDGRYSKDVYDQQVLDNAIFYGMLYETLNEVIYGIGTIQFDEYGHILSGESYTIGSIKVTQYNVESLVRYYSNHLSNYKTKYDRMLNSLYTSMETNRDSADYWNSSYKWTNNSKW